MNRQIFSNVQMPLLVRPNWRLIYPSYRVMLFNWSMTDEKETSPVSILYSLEVHAVYEIIRRQIDLRDQVGLFVHASVKTGPLSRVFLIFGRLADFFGGFSCRRIFGQWLFFGGGGQIRRLIDLTRVSDRALERDTIHTQPYHHLHYYCHSSSLWLFSPTYSTDQ